jgi:hypothetical protein
LAVHGDKKQPMSESKIPSDRFHTFVAVLIALVTVIGAIISWRVASVLDAAGSADVAGLRALTDREDAITRAHILWTEHRTAHVAYTENDALAETYKALARAHPERTDLAHYGSTFGTAANQALDAIPEQYLDRDEQLDDQRDLGENIAQSSFDKDIEPQPHFANADVSRQKARGLFGAVRLLGVTALGLTIVDALKHPLRYLFLLGGLALFALAVMVALFIELLGALGLL